MRARGEGRHDVPHMFPCYPLPMTDPHGHHTVARQDLLFAVEMALRKAEHLWPKRSRPGDHDRLKPMARRIVDHLELCGMRCVAKGPAPLHGTLAPRPAPRQDGAADEGDAGNA